MKKADKWMIGLMDYRAAAARDFFQKSIYPSKQSMRRFSFVIFAPRLILIFAVRVYQLLVSPAQLFLFGANAGCRFTPTCSQFAIEAIRERGAMAGSWMALKRICRCHPFGNCGHEPVPKKNPKSEIENPQFI